jgi:integrase
MDQQIRWTDAKLKALPLPKRRWRIEWLGPERFGLRLSAGGARSFVIRYRNKDGVDREHTIGRLEGQREAGGVWTLAGAREEAKRLLREIDAGRADPVQDGRSARESPTAGDLLDRFEKEHLPRLKASSQRDYRGIIAGYLRPRLGGKKVAAVVYADVDGLHREIAERAPYRANRVVAVLSKAMSLAVRWQMRADNPCRTVERRPEPNRERFLSEAEIARLGDALAQTREKVSANAIRLMLLTGARRGEVLGAEWSEFDLDKGIWHKPGIRLKQKRDHHLALNAPARALLAEMRKEAAEDARFLFPGSGTKPLREIKKLWASVTRKAGIGKMVPILDESGKQRLGKDGKPLMKWKADARMHDMRHTVASILASQGQSLAIIGSVLGHSQPAVTARYSHLVESAQRAAMEAVGKVIAPPKGAEKPSAEVVRLPKAG